MGYNNFQINEMHAALINQPANQWQEVLQKIITPTATSSSGKLIAPPLPPKMPPPPPLVKGKQVAIQSPEEIIKLQKILEKLKKSDLSKDIINSLEEELKSRSIKFCIANKNILEIHDESAKNIWFDGALAFALNTKFKNCAKGSEKDIEIQKLRQEAETVIQAVFADLWKQKSYQEIHNLFLVCYKHRDSADGLSVIYETVNKIFKALNAQKIEAELKKDPEIEQKLGQIESQKTHFVNLHKNLRDALANKQLNLENYKEDASYKSLQNIIKDRDTYVNHYKVSINLERELDKKINRLEKERQENIQKLEWIIATSKKTKENNSDTLSKLPLQALAARQGLATGIKLSEEKIQETTLKLAALQQEEQNKQQLDKIIIEQLLTQINRPCATDNDILLGLSLVTDASKLNSLHYLRAKKEQVANESAKKKLLADAYQIEVTFKGRAQKKDLVIQVESEKSGRVFVKRDFSKSTYLGLLAKPQGIKALSLIVPAHQEKEFTSNKEFTVMSENELAEKMHPKMDEDGKKATAQDFDFMPYLEFLAPIHLTQLALFFGFSYYTDAQDFGGSFDPANPEHRQKLIKDLAIKLKNTRVTMADIIQVGLGLQFRDPSIEEKFQNLRENKYKNLEELPGDQFFAKSPKESIKLISELAEKEMVLIPQIDLIKRLNVQEIKEQLPFLKETFEQLEQSIKNGFIEKLQYLGTLASQDAQTNTAYGLYKQSLSTDNFAKPILDCLAHVEDIYSTEGQKALLVACLDASILWEKLKKATVDIQKEIDASLQRIAAHKAALDRLSNAQVNQHNADLFVIRQSVKIDLLGTEQTEESEKQKELLDKLARHIFQQRYPKVTLDAEDAILEEVQNNEIAIESVKDKIAVEKVRGTEEEVQRLQETLKKLEEENAMLKLELEALQKIQQEFVHNKEELARNKDELAQNQQDLEIHKKLLANAQDELLCFKVLFEEQQQELMISTKDLANQKEQLHQVRINLELQQKELAQSTLALSQQTAFLSQTTVELEEQRKQLHSSRSVLEKQSSALQQNKAAFQKQAVELEKSKATLLEQNREIAKNKALLEKQQAELEKNKSAMQKQFIDLELKAAEVEENKRLLSQTQQALKSKQVELDKLKNTTYTPAMNMVRKETPAEVYLRTKSVDEMFGCAAQMGYKTLEPRSFLSWMNVSNREVSATRLALASKVIDYNATGGESFRQKYSAS